LASQPQQFGVLVETQLAPSRRIRSDRGVRLIRNLMAYSSH
jgi:hypothetical protein